jgi:hypothetical protein
MIAGLPPEDSNAEVSQWLEMAASDTDVANVLDLISREPEWVNLFNAFEVVCSSVGGRKGLLEKLSTDRCDKDRLAQAIDRFTHSAQPHRHGRAKGRSPSKAMSLDEAFDLLREVASRYLRHRTMPAN